MAIAKKFTGSDGEEIILIFCPACKSGHHIRVKNGKRELSVWDWNESLESPTFIPSLLCYLDKGKICHSYITDGKIRFLKDCSHNMAGQTVPLEKLQ